MDKQAMQASIYGEQLSGCGRGSKEPEIGGKKLKGKVCKWRKGERQRRKFGRLTTVSQPASQQILTPVPRGRFSKVNPVFGVEIYMQIYIYM